MSETLKFRLEVLHVLRVTCSLAKLSYLRRSKTALVLRPRAKSSKNLLPKGSGEIGELLVIYGMT